MTSSPRLSDLPLWERHEERVLATLRRALVLLGSRLPVDGGEPALNRAMYFSMLAANNERHRQGYDSFDNAPVWEGRNPPSPETLGSPSERKIPDFYWGFIDHDEPDPDRAVRNFVIECKRLGPVSASGWAFNPRYIEDGVVRFIDPGWRYGKDVSSGAMIGFIERANAPTVLGEVNATASLRSIPVLTVVSAEPPVHEVAQVLIRSFSPSPFRLVHLWRDALLPPPEKPSSKIASKARSTRERILAKNKTRDTESVGVQPDVSDQPNSAGMPAGSWT